MNVDELHAELVRQGCAAECVEWVCDEHRRGCTRLGTEHDEHACYWCEH